jgi:hypothetical protein
MLKGGRWGEEIQQMFFSAMLNLNNHYDVFY